MFISWRRLVALVLFGFLLGAGALAGYESLTLQSRPGRRSHSSGRLMSELCRELEMTGDQKALLERTLEESRQRMVELNRSMRPRYRQIKLETREHIRAILSPDQVGRFNGLVRKWDERRRKRTGGGSEKSGS